MNKYYFTFIFNDNFEFISFTANQLANSTIGKSDDILNIVCLDDEEVFTNTFIAENGIKYCASWENPCELSIYNTDEDGGALVEKNVKWILLKIVNGKGEVIYNLSDNV